MRPERHANQAFVKQRIPAPGQNDAAIAALNTRVAIPGRCGASSPARQSRQRSSGSGRAVGIHDPPPAACSTDPEAGLPGAS